MSETTIRSAELMVEECQCGGTPVFREVIGIRPDNAEEGRWITLLECPLCGCQAGGSTLVTTVVNWDTFMLSRHPSKKVVLHRAERT